MSRFLVTGGRGFIGKHLTKAIRRCNAGGEVVSVGREYDLTDRDQVRRLFNEFGLFDYILHAADLQGNALWSAENAATQFHGNAAMGLNVLEAWSRYQPQSRLIGLSSLWAYPERVNNACEETYWDGPMHSPTEHYGMVKKFMGVGLEAYKRQHGLRGTFLVLGSVYGPDDASFHVIPSLIRRMQENPKELEIWGDGTQRRDFVYVDDAVEGILLHLEFGGALLNIGSGITHSISEVVDTLVKIMRYEGKITYNTSKGIDTPYRTLDMSRALSLTGWPSNFHFHSLQEGLLKTIQSVIHSHHA